MSNTENQTENTSAADEAKVGAARKRVHEAFGSVALNMMSLQRYRNLTLQDLDSVILNPLMRDRIAFASSSKPKDDENNLGSVTGIAIWASVSSEVDAKINEQIKSGVFPIRMAPDDWNSGDINWLFDIIAGDQETITSVVSNFQQIMKKGDLRVHPLVTGMLDPKVLEQMGAKRIDENTK